MLSTTFSTGSELTSVGQEELRHDTVGGIAIAADLTAVAVCSTGGNQLRMPGRVSHAAQYGAGVWTTVQAHCSVTATTTGGGEYISMTHLAQVYSFFRYVFALKQFTDHRRMRCRLFV